MMLMRFQVVALLTLASHGFDVSAATDNALAEAQALALETPEINANPSPQYNDDARDVNMTIGMERTPGGRLYACWVSGGDSELAYFVIATSDDNGDSWSKPRWVIDPPEAPSGLPIRTLVGNFWTDPTGRLWLFFDISSGFFDGRAGVWATVCDNPDADKPVWSTPHRICDGALLNKPIVLENGQWLMPTSLWRRDYIRASSETRRQTFDQSITPAGYLDQFLELDDQRATNVLVSGDEGKTWKKIGNVRFPRFNFDEPMVVELRDGRLWMLARTHAGIHESYSSDGGGVWEEPKLRFPHINSRFHLRRLASGNILLVRHGKIDQKTPGRSHLTAFLSDDEGCTWKGGLLLDERSNISYPDGAEGPDGFYYLTYDNDRYGAAEILLARFREEDVLAKDFVTPGAATKILVNRATGKKRLPLKK